MMTKIESLYLEIRNKFEMFDEHVSKIYIFRDEIAKEEIDSFFSNTAILKKDLTSLKELANKLENNDTKHTIIKFCKNIDNLVKKLMNLNNTLSKNNYEQFHSDWHEIKYLFNFYIIKFIGRITFIRDLHTRMEDLFSLTLRFHTNDFDYGQIEDSISSLPDIYKYTTRQPIAFDVGGAILAVTILSATANLLAITDILYNWIREYKKKKKEKEKGQRSPGMSVTTQSRDIDVDLEDLTSSSINISLGRSSIRIENYEIELHNLTREKIHDILNVLLKEKASQNNEQE